MKMAIFGKNQPLSTNINLDNQKNHLFFWDKTKQIPIMNLKSQLFFNLDLIIFNSLTLVNLIA